MGSEKGKTMSSDITLLTYQTEVNPGDRVHSAASASGFDILVPDGLGIMPIQSECGLWSGEINIVDRNGKRYIDWLKMTAPNNCGE